MSGEAPGNMNQFLGKEKNAFKNWSAQEQGATCEEKGLPWGRGTQKICTFKEG